MKKREIKNILFSMRNVENEESINNLLRKMDLLSEEKLHDILGQVGDNENMISPILHKGELKFLNELDFKTRILKNWGEGDRL